MNITQLEIDCKINGRKVFENFKHSLLNFPLDNKISTDVVEAIILFEVKQNYGRKVLKNHINSNLSKKQLKLISLKIKEYENLIIKTCWVLSRNVYNL